METLFELQSILIGLIGWGGTALAVKNASRLTPNDRRAMIVCCWMIWMIPSSGVLVLNNLITTEMAALYVGVTTGLLGVIMFLGAIVRPRTRP